MGLARILHDSERPEVLCTDAMSPGTLHGVTISVMLSERLVKNPGYSMALGRKVTICGNTVISTTASTMRKKNGSAARAM